MRPRADLTFSSQRWPFQFLQTYGALECSDQNERGLSPEQVAEALPKLDRDASWNWCVKMDFDAWVGNLSLSH
jgi:hypothetical protein